MATNIAQGSGVAQEAEPTSTFKPWTYETSPSDILGDESDKSKGDCWNVPVKYWTEQEKEKCDAWKDEVQNLLVFAGLFSAVVTGLLIDSYQSLRENTSEVLLAQISAQLATMANPESNSTALTQSAAPFSPSTSSKRINSLWFLSLILSLATALVGIVAQQWLREHLRPSTRNIPIRCLPALLHMQAEALDRFYVPQIFTALPLLLILSLILFLVGMVEFLWDLNHHVAIPGIIGIGFIFAFLLYTTVRPGLQSLPGHIPRQQMDKPDAPCPYKSPQSWAFLRLATVAKFFVVQSAQSVSSALKLSGDDTRMSQMRDRRWWRHIFEAQKYWINFGMLSLQQRDIDRLAHRSEASRLLRYFTRPDPGHSSFLPRYDTIHSLNHIKLAFNLTGSNELPELYQCFCDLTSFEHGEENKVIAPLIGYTYDILSSIYPMSLPKDHLQQIDSEGPEELHVELIRLSFMDVTTAPSRYQIFMCIRLLGWTLDRLEAPCGFQGTNFLWPISFLDLRYIRRDHDDFNAQVHAQVFYLLETFFSRAMHLQPPSNNLGHNVYTTQFVSALLYTIATLHSAGVSQDLITRHDTLLSAVAKKIASGTGSDYLFATASCYAWHSLRSRRHEGLLQALGSQRHHYEAASVIATLDHVLNPWERFFFDNFKKFHLPPEEENNDVEDIAVNRAGTINPEITEKRSTATDVEKDQESSTQAGESGRSWGPQNDTLNATVIDVDVTNSDKPRGGAASVGQDTR